MYAIRKIRCYIEGYHFIIKTDHMVLKYIQSIKKPIGRLAPLLSGQLDVHLPFENLKISKVVKMEVVTEKKISEE